MTQRSSADDVTRIVIMEAKGVFDQCLEKIGHCLSQLSDEQVWWRPHESQNSIGNLILHLTGNVRQWIVSGLGGKDDVRDRPGEFSERDPISADTLLARLVATVDEAKGVLGRSSSEDMLIERRIQGFDVSGWKALFDSLPHFKGHTQEIICLTRMQLGEGYRFHWQPQTPEQGAPRAL